MWICGSGGGIDKHSSQTPEAHKHVGGEMQHRPCINSKVNAWLAIGKNSHEISQWVKYMAKKDIYGEFLVQRRVIQFMATVNRRRDGGVVIFINVSRGFIMIF